MDQFYEKAGSLFVGAYDAFYSGSEPQIAGDRAFYQRIAAGLSSSSLVALGVLPYPSPKRDCTLQESTDRKRC